MTPGNPDPPIVLASGRYVLKVVDSPTGEAKPNHENSLHDVPHDGLSDSGSGRSARPAVSGGF